MSIITANTKLSEKLLFFGNKNVRLNRKLYKH